MNIKKKIKKSKALLTKQEGQNVYWNADKMNQLPAKRKIISKFLCFGFYIKKNVASTLISFAVLK